MDSVSRLCETNGFKMFDALAGSQPLQDHSFFILQLGRDEDRNRLPYYFFRCVSEDALGAAVPAGDDSVQIFGNDRVVGRFHDGRKLGQRLLSGLPISNVLDYPSQTVNVSLRVEHGKTPRPHPAQTPVGMSDAKLLVKFPGSLGFIQAA